MPQDPVSDQRSDPLGTAIDDANARIEALEKTGQWWPGMISWTAAATAPQGWLVADGSTFDGDRYAALAAVLGGTTLPDLRNRFPIGAGDTYALLDTGGAETHQLTAAESGQPAIAAGTSGSTTPGSTGAGTAHSHSGTTGAGSAHHHGADIGTAYLYGGAVTFTVQSGTGFNIATSSNTANESAHTHSFTTGTEAAHTHASAAHTHTTPAIAAAAAASAHSILNPYVGLTPLIHI